MTKTCLNPDTLFDSRQYGFSQIVVARGSRMVFGRGRWPGMKTRISSARMICGRRCGKVDLWVVQDGRDVVNGTGRDCHGNERIDPFIGRARAEQLLQQGNQNVTMFDAAGVGLEAFILLQIRPSRHLTELSILSHHYPRPGRCNCRRLETSRTERCWDARCHNVRVSGRWRSSCEPRWPAGRPACPGEPRQCTVPGRCAPMMERRQNRAGGEQPGGDVHNGHADFVWLASGRAADGHDTALGLDHEIIAGPVTIGAGLPIAADGAVDEAGIVRADRVVIQPHAGHCPRLEVFDEDVGPADQFFEDGFALFAFEVEGETLLVAVDAEKIGAFIPYSGRPPLAGTVTHAGLLDFDDSRAVIGQEHGAVWPGQDAG